jgi:Tfp pilus assembly PilM family ATPase
MAEVRIPLAQTIEAVRRELAESVRSAACADIQFPVGEVTLEFQVGVTKAGEGSIGVNVWVVEMGAGGSHSRETAQTVTISLGAPVDQQGRPIKVSSLSSDKPR